LAAIVSNLNHLTSRLPVSKELVTVLSLSALALVTIILGYYHIRARYQSGRSAFFK
jgi:hypothetical protein